MIEQLGSVADCVNELWTFLYDEDNRGVVTLICGGIAAVIAAGWTVFKYRNERKDIVPTPDVPARPCHESLSVNLGEKETVKDWEIAGGIVREGEGYANGAKDSVHYWCKRFASDRVRHLIINGPSGRGKTFFAKQLRYELIENHPRSRHAWLDCTEHRPSSHTLWRLLRQLVPEDERAKFDAVFPQSTDDVQSGSEFAETAEVTSLLSPPAPPLYLYLDDFHRYADALGDTRQAFTSFLTTFGESRSCLRIIATSRDSSLDEQLKKTLSRVERLVGETGDALSPFSDADTRKYIETRGGILEARLDEGEVDRLLQLVRGDPLTLALIEDELELRAEKADTNQEWLRSLLKHDEDKNLPLEDRPNFLRGFVFEKQMGRASRDARTVAEALAVVADLEFNPFNLLRRDDKNKDDLILKLLDEVVTELDASSIPIHIRDLQDRGILKPDSYLFAIDSMQEYLVQEYLVTEKEKEMRRRAQQAYAKEDLPAFAIWHQIAAGDVEEGFDALSQATHRLQAEFRYEELRPLYRRLRQIFWKEQEHERDWRWAVAQVKLAETLYCGFDITDAEPAKTWQGTLVPEQNEWQLVKTALPKLETYLSNSRLRPRDPGHLRTLVDAYVRGRMTRAVFIFENPRMIPDDDPLKRYTKPRDSVWLATEIKETLAVLSQHNVRLDPPLIANYTCLQGCFYNGGAMLEEACAAFRQAEEVLEAYETELAERSITLNDTQRCGLEQDRLDIANDWSRSRFLLHGPDAALARLQDFLEEKADLLDTVEYTYSLINVCYYYHARGEWQRMRECLDRAYKPGVDVTSLPKPVDDKYKVAPDNWAQQYLDALEIAYRFYTSDLSQPETVEPIAAEFRGCADKLGTHGWPRDQMMLNANSYLVEMAAAGDFASRRAVMEKFEHSLREVQTDEESILDEPIVRDMLGYLKACFAVKDGQPKSDPDGAVDRTRLRFPALLGEGCPTLLKPGWKPPILLRGALLMRTNPCAPMPAELGISVW